VCLAEDVQRILICVNGLVNMLRLEQTADLQLLGFDPQTREVVISQRLSGTQYQSLSGIFLADPIPKSHRPSSDVLDKLWHKFQKEELKRYPK
jgi:hypothetical protein